MLKELSGRAIDAPPYPARGSLYEIAGVVLCLAFAGCTSDASATARDAGAQAASTPARKESAPRPVESAPTPNPYALEVERKRAEWTLKRPRDYVFVLQDQGQVMFQEQWQQRIVVKGGVATSARSLVYGMPARTKAPTVEDVFDKVLYHATFGDQNRPARFEVEYDARYGFPLSMQSDGRGSVADDEHSLDIACFSTDPDGCRPIALSKAQCARAGGQLVESANPDCANMAIGIVDDTHFCCRAFTRAGYDDITPAQCRAALGVEQPCGRDTIPVGGSQTRQAGCCRRFVK